MKNLKKESSFSKFESENPLNTLYSEDDNV